QGNITTQRPIGGRIRRPLRVPPESSFESAENGMDTSEACGALKTGFPEAQSSFEPPIDERTPIVHYASGRQGTGRFRRMSQHGFFQYTHTVHSYHDA